MALTVPQKLTLSEIIRKSYAITSARVSSLNLDADQEAYLVAEIALWATNRNKLKVTLKGEVEFDTVPLLNEIRVRVLNVLGFSVGGVAGVFAGGISKTDKDAREANSDRVAPGFTIDLHKTFLSNPYE